MTKRMIKHQTKTGHTATRTAVARSYTHVVVVVADECTGHRARGWVPGESHVISWHYSQQTAESKAATDRVQRIYRDTAYVERVNGGSRSQGA